MRTYDDTFSGQKIYPGKVCQCLSIEEVVGMEGAGRGWNMKSGIGRSNKELVPRQPSNAMPRQFAIDSLMNSRRAPVVSSPGS